MGAREEPAGSGHFRNFQALTDERALEQPAVLVLGGSTFMGRALVEALVARPARVCVVNRGRTYWGTDDPSSGRAARVIADRRDAKEFAARLDAATQHLGAPWDLVADFSAFNGGDIRAALDGLRGRFATYAYISSDSIYEVGAWAAASWSASQAPAAAARPDLSTDAGPGTAPSVGEACGERPADKVAQRRLRKADTYGHGKLEAEEALAEGLLEDCALQCRSVSLRLPDVIGPFDDTLRLWAYWHWVRAAETGANPPQVRCARPAKRQRLNGSSSEKDEAGEEAREVPQNPQLAFVFSHDVARFIVALLDYQPPPDAPRADAVNVGCECQPTLREFVTLFGEVSCAEGERRLAAVERPRSFLPSVDRPWPLDWHHLIQAYGFRATPLRDVLKACADWFEQACTEFPGEARRAAKKVPGEASGAALQLAGLEAGKASSSSSGGDSSDSSSS